MLAGRSACAHAQPCTEPYSCLCLLRGTSGTSRLCCTVGNASCSWCQVTQSTWQQKILTYRWQWFFESLCLITWKCVRTLINCKAAGCTVGRVWLHFSVYPSIRQICSQLNSRKRLHLSYLSEQECEVTDGLRYQDHGFSSNIQMGNKWRKMEGFHGVPRNSVTIDHFWRVRLEESPALCFTAILSYHPSPKLIKTHSKLKWCPFKWDELCDSYRSELAPWRITLTLNSFITNLSKKTAHKFHIRLVMKQAHFCSFLGSLWKSTPTYKNAKWVALSRVE